MEWKFVKSQLSEKEILEVEKLLNIKLPIEFKNIVIKYNGGQPIPYCFDLNNEKEKVFSSLINFDLNAKNNVLVMLKSLENINNIIPFGLDPFGNFICFQYQNSENPNIVFYNHENNEIKLITESFNNFLKLLF